MTHLIDKAALVAEIENLLDKSTYLEEYDCAYRDGNNGALYALKGKLDTLEVQEEPVSEDLEEVAKERVDAEDYCYVDEGGMPLYDSGYLEYMFKEGAKWQLAKNKSITPDDLGEFTNELSKQFPEVSFAKVCKIVTRTAKWLMLNLN